MTTMFCIPNIIYPSSRRISTFYKNFFYFHILFFSFMWFQGGKSSSLGRLTYNPSTLLPASCHYLFPCGLLLLQVLTLSSWLKHPSINTWERITDLLRLFVTISVWPFHWFQTYFQIYSVSYLVQTIGSIPYWIHGRVCVFGLNRFSWIDLLLQIIQF